MRLLHAVASSLLLGAAGAHAAADGESCKLGDACAGEAEGAADGEVSSLLQQQRRRGDSPAESSCPITGMALTALQSGIMSVFGDFFTDIELHDTQVERKYNLQKKCSVDASMKASMNVTGITGLRMSSFDCNDGDCRKRGLFDVCTRYRVGAAVEFIADEFVVTGHGDADLGFKGKWCKVLKHLPDIPSFETSIRVVKPKVTFELSVDLTMNPLPGVKNPQFEPVGISYDRLQDFNCGMSWFPSVNAICGDWVDQILDDSKEKILKMANEQIQGPEFEDAFARAAAAAPDSDQES